MLIPLKKLMAAGWKVTETKKDLSEGRLSKNLGAILVSRISGGKFFILDGHHRALEAMARNEKTICAEISEHVPHLEKTGGAYDRVLKSATKLNSH